MNAERLIDAFGCNGGPAAAEIPNVIVRALTARIAGTVCDRLSGDAGRALAGPLSTLRDGGSLAWQPELGIAQKLADSNPIAAALQLTVAAAGVDDIAVCLPEAAVVYLDGWFVQLPAEGCVRLAEGTMEFEDGGERVAFGRMQDQWWPSNGGHAGQQVLASGSPAFRHVVKLRCKGSTGMFPTLPDPSSPRAETVADVNMDGSSSAELARALALLQSLPDGVARWVHQATHAIWFSGGPAPVASSSPLYPGAVALRESGTWQGYFEAIASSVAQQKLHQLLLLEPLTENGAEEVHYVPPFRSYITTRRALAAAYEHAHVVRLLHAAANAAPGPAAEAMRRRALRRALRLDAECAAALDASRALGPVGSALWKDIKEFCYDLEAPSWGGYQGPPALVAAEESAGA
jgi:HEXXH motif-containing protein